MLSRLKNWLKKSRVVAAAYNFARKFVFNNKKTRAELENEVIDLQERLDWFIAHSEITALKPATGYLRKKQLDLVDFANAFFDEIKTLDLHPFLICGNLIGAYRHKGFVPWDDDLDFGLIRNEYETLIEYCKQNFHVALYNGKWSEYNTDKHLDRMNNLVLQHPNEFILDIWIDQIQIMRGTSAIDRLAIDFWSFDYYSDDYKIGDHIKYLKELDEQKKKINYVDKIVRFLNEKRSSNKNISQNPTASVFPGIDNVEGYLRMHRTSSWLKTEYLFPLKKVEYESTCYYIPNNVKKWLEYEYPDYMSYPSEAGRMPHENYKEKFIVQHMPTVEFYLIDAFEIYHFIPLYNFFEKNGIFSQFIAVPPQKKDAWFDYKDAVRILEKNGLRFKTKPNYKADYVFTTQEMTHIENYKNKKIHMCYGMSLTTYSFCESQKTIEGFDLKLIHGNVSYNIVREKNKTLPLIKIGYPRYTSWGKRKYLYDESEREKLIREKNIENKPVLLYFPTWDKNSSIVKYESGFRKLKEKYFIITKAHHCTFRLASEEKHRQILQSISDVILEGNYSFGDAVKLSGLVVCDAVSGAATEVPFINQKTKLVLLKSPIASKNQFKDFFNRYAICADSSEHLVEAVENISKKDPFVENREKIIRELYSDEIDLSFHQLKEYIINNCSKRRYFH